MLSKEKKTENIFKSLLTLIEISLRFFLSFFSRDNRYPRFCFFFRHSTCQIFANRQIFSNFPRIRCPAPPSCLARFLSSTRLTLFLSSETNLSAALTQMSVTRTLGPVKPAAVWKIISSTRDSPSVVSTEASASSTSLDQNAKDQREKRICSSVTI